MTRGKMAKEAIIEAVRQLLQQAAITGEKLNGMAVARRVGCGRTTLYTNADVRALLLQAGIIDDTPPVKQDDAGSAGSRMPSGSREPTASEQRLRRAEERASRLELLLAESQERVRLLEAENQGLRMRLRLMGEGRSML